MIAGAEGPVKMNLSRTGGFLVRTGELPKLDIAELAPGEHFRTGSVQKVSLSDIGPDETWYDHHNVPEMYRGLSVGAGDKRMTVSDASTELVLDALDPDESLRAAGEVLPDLVAWLAVPVEYEETPLLGYTRATVSLVEIDRLKALHVGLSAALEEMQQAKKPPRTKDYFLGLRRAFCSNGKPPTDEDGPKSGGKSGRRNPFEYVGMTTLEFQKRFGGHRKYVAVNSLWKPGEVMESDDRSGIWAGVCRFAANGLASMGAALSPTWEVSMMTYRPTAMSGIR